LAKKRVSRNERRQAHKTRELVTKFEATFGSKTRLASALSALPEVKNAREAKKIINEMEGGEGRQYKTLLDKIKPEQLATPEQTEAYASKRAARQERAITTNRRIKAKKTAVDELQDKAQTEGQTRFAKRAADQSKRVFNDGVVLYGSKNSGKYVRAMGIVDQYQNVDKQVMKTYYLMVYEDALVQHTGKMKRNYMIPGFEKMSTAKRAEAIAEQFYDLTDGNGRLLAFEYRDTTEQDGT
jgi:hypothetical protein